MLQIQLNSVCVTVFGYNVQNQVLNGVVRGVLHPLEHASFLSESENGAKKNLFVICHTCNYTMDAQ